MQEIAAARAAAATRAGEISIVRANQARSTEQYDIQLAALHKAMAESAAMHKEEVQAARAEGRRIATENAFLKHDLMEEARQRNIQKPKGKSIGREPPVTPKKTKGLLFRDGFDDDEILAVSPSRSAEGRPRRGAPMVPGKRRKREDEDGHVHSLQLSQEAAAMEEPDQEMRDRDVVEQADKRTLVRQVADSNVLYMKRILNHRTRPYMQRDMEVMGSLAFPSEPQRMLSSIVLEKMTSAHSGNCLVSHGEAIASMWSRSLKEKFFKPVPIFVSNVKLILAINGPSCAPKLVGHIVPVLQDSAEVNGVRRFHYSPTLLGAIRQIPQSELQPEVESTAALRLLRDVACACLHIDGAMEDFWRQIRYNFILMTLNCSQPIQDITLSLDLLMTSIRRDSFGPILDTEENQRANEAYIVDRAASLLSEQLLVDEGRESYVPFEICDMRLQVIAFLSAVAFGNAACATTHGSFVIADHPTVLARLVRAMHDEVDALSSCPPEQDLRSSLVNGLMRLIYGVLQNSGSGVVDLQTKLRRVAGAKQKFLVVLTRLAFSDGLILEAAITDATVEMAHEILDSVVNPQEAEALLDAFPSVQSPG